MMRRRPLRWLIWALTALALSAGAATAGNTDLAKEKRWEKQIVPELFSGDAVKLKAGGVEFLALFTETATEPARGGVIVMHGIGAHPAWPDVIEPLRTRLPEQGWHTLSLQMPILENDAGEKDYPPLFDEVPARIQAGVDFLKSKGIDNIVLSAHSMGTTMATYYLAQQPDPAVRGFVIVSGGPGYPPDMRMDTLTLVRKIDLPILDVYGSNDSDRVKGASEKRAEMFAGRNDYTRVRVDGANHFYQGREDALIKDVSDWLAMFAATQ
jgi:pimeloyl-ACP methyl ester carboxylesterase